MGTKTARGSGLWPRTLIADPVRVLPGNTSEHTTGLALDILSPRHDEADDSFGETPEGLWLAENAWKYGFILRYPEGKEALTGVIYEPWHFRYVGKQSGKRDISKRPMP